MKLVGFGTSKKVKNPWFRVKGQKRGKLPSTPGPASGPEGTATLLCNAYEKCQIHVLGAPSMLTLQRFMPSSRTGRLLKTPTMERFVLLLMRIGGFLPHTLLPPSPTVPPYPRDGPPRPCYLRIGTLNPFYASFSVLWKLQYSLKQQRFESRGEQMFVRSTSAQDSVNIRNVLHMLTDSDDEDQSSLTGTVNSSVCSFNCSSHSFSNIVSLDQALLLTLCFQRKISDLIDTFMEAFSCVFIIYFLFYSTSVTMSLYFGFRLASMGLPHLAPDSLILSIANFIGVLLYVNTSTSVSNNRQTSFRRFEKRLLLDVKLSRNPEARRLLHALKQPVELSLASCAVLNRAILTTVLGHMVSYLIIALQLGTTISVQKDAADNSSSS
ncbi:hypothetical protein FHG87_010136 [Trinorchestia longiramus]|nr:hypothetical protein FHG87_010136 [Trinorchestia longiramus]